MENKYLRLYKSLSAVSASLFLILAVLMLFSEVIHPDWKTYQHTYRDMMQKDSSGENAAPFRIGIKQIEIRETNHIDRCLTCHVTIGSPVSNALPLPFSAHPDRILENHDLSNFGCTVCHTGSGRSLLYDETCNPATVPGWKPIESNCSHCHLAVFERTAGSLLPDIIQQGRDLFYSSGCLGCHKLRNSGGRFGPDLTRQGEKIRQGYNFKNVQGGRTVFNWHLEHFRNPSLISPGSIMPAFSFSQSQLELLATFILGFSRPALPFRYYNLNVLQEFKGQRTRLPAGDGYSLICRSCHGEKGLGRDYKKQVFGVPGIANQDFQAAASADLIAFSIEEGRGNRYMPSWKSRHSGLEESEIADLIQSVRALRAPAPTFEQVSQAAYNQQEGMRVFMDNCSSCHGSDLSGGIGPSLDNQSFRLLASDRFLYKTLARGRANTAMPAWSRLDAASLKNLIRFIQPIAKQVNESRNESLFPELVAKGKDVFHYRCSRCHGVEGQGGIGPAILKHDFLESAADAFLLGMITQGRSHTPMFSITRDRAEIQALLQFMRSQKENFAEYIDPGPTLGNQANGEKLFKKFCKECHGPAGEGSEAPALNNQEFLNAASNGYLLATMTLGREETPMPAWGKNRENQRALTSGERQDLTAFIRHWQTIKITSGKINMTSRN
jgi:mono/diheme cytochrome c family protein